MEEHWKMGFGASGERRSKIIPGDIAPHVLPTMKKDLDHGDWRKALETGCSLSIILHTSSQLSELIAFQLMFQELFKAYFHERTARLHECLKNKELIVAREMSDNLLGASQLAEYCGTLKNVAYRFVKVDNELSLKSRDNAYLLWIRYMKKKIKRYNDPFDIMSMNAVVQRYTSSLQACCRRFLTWTLCKTLPECLQRNRIRSAYIIVVRNRQHAAEVLGGFIRRSLLARKLLLLQGIVQNNASIEIRSINEDMLGKTRKNTHRNIIHDIKTEYVRLQQAEQVQQEDLQPKSKRYLNLDSIPAEDLGTLVGLDVRPEVGMRVQIAKSALTEYPELAEDSSGGFGTITWVDPEDADGDGETGDICEVVWDKTGKTGDYRTGFEGDFRLSAAAGYRVRKEGQDDSEVLVGLDVRPEVGMRVQIAKSALTEYPELAEDSSGGFGTITWVDPEDADGDGETGDICEVVWDKTGKTGDYRTGFEGDFRLSAAAGYRVRNEGQDYLDASDGSGESSQVDDEVSVGSSDGEGVAGLAIARHIRAFIARLEFSIVRDLNLITSIGLGFGQPLLQTYCLRLQSVCKGHISRRKTWARLSAGHILDVCIDLAVWKSDEKFRKVEISRGRYLIRIILRSWCNICKEKKATRGRGAVIRYRHRSRELNRWFTDWLDFHQSFLEKLPLVKNLMDIGWKFVVYQRLTHYFFSVWHSNVNRKMFLKAMFQGISSLSSRYIQRKYFDAMKAHLEKYHSTLAALEVISGRKLSLHWIQVLAAWHDLVSRSRAMRNVSLTLLRAWQQGLVSSHLKHWRYHDLPGQQTITNAEISTLKLKLRYANVTSKTKGLLARFIQPKARSFLPDVARKRVKEHKRSASKMNTLFFDDLKHGKGETPALNLSLSLDGGGSRKKEFENEFWTLRSNAYLSNQELLPSRQRRPLPKYTSSLPSILPKLTVDSFSLL
uniref:Uncharacterized protein n=1 Tax=Guillardia theta TaxID=55529 RepID=A0A7S4PSI8_GUITH|mmetsp:Transcript_9571/g.32036  ORF Transcript_9571/g.32036 Transcript_9571/m.32036 type:complete len:948 (+) Transcript_9571:143-2986(+)